MIIKLNEVASVIVDDADYELISGKNWYISSSKGGLKYAGTKIWVRGLGHRHVYMHRFIVDPPEKFVIDHINGNGLDNRRENLRVCTPQQNMFNMRVVSNKTSKYRGVYWDSRTNKWKASIRIDNKKVYIGSFDDEIEAAKKYDQTCLETRGEFARTNFHYNTLLKGEVSHA